MAMKDSMSEAKRLVKEFLEQTRDEEGREGTFRVDIVPGPEGEHDLQPVAITLDGQEIFGERISPNMADMINLFGSVAKVTGTGSPAEALRKLVRELP